MPRLQYLWDELEARQRAQKIYNVWKAEHPNTPTALCCAIEADTYKYCLAQVTYERHLRESEWLVPLVLTLGIAASPIFWIIWTHLYA